MNTPNTIKEKPNSAELEKSTSHPIVEKYVPHSVEMKTVTKKSTGNIRVMSFHSGEVLTQKTSPFDTLALIIEGNAAIAIDKTTNLSESGQELTTSAHSLNLIKRNERFTMILNHYPKRA